MARFYLSHSERDAPVAEKLAGWLAEHATTCGLSRLTQSAALADELATCRKSVEEIRDSDVIMLLCSRAWSASKQCYAEYLAAQLSGGFLIALMLEELDEGFSLLSEIPRFHLDPDGNDLGNLASVLSAFERTDPYLHDWKAGQAPYPGLCAYDETKAGIFFGRDADVQKTVTRISAHLANDRQNMTMLVGPTGSGVSSLMRAGVLPELNRNADGAIITVPVIRPRLRPLDAFAYSLATALDQEHQWRSLADQLTRAIPDDLGECLEALAADLRDHCGSTDAKILVPIDQLEELVDVSETNQAEAFQNLISTISTGGFPIHIVATAGSETFKMLRSKLGDCSFAGISIKPIPPERFDELIRGPAQRAGLSIDDGLVDAIVEDAATAASNDRLSKVAHSLSQLWRAEAQSGHLTTAGYERLAGDDGEQCALETSVAASAESALDQVEASPDERRAVVEVLSELTVQFDESAGLTRRPAFLEEFPRETLKLIDELVEAGLLQNVQVADQNLVELTSPAVLRLWPRLERNLKALYEGPDVIESRCKELACQPLHNPHAPDKMHPPAKRGAFIRTCATAASHAAAVFTIIAVVMGLQHAGRVDKETTEIQDSAIGYWFANTLASPSLRDAGEGHQTAAKSTKQQEEPGSAKIALHDRSNSKPLAPQSHQRATSPKRVLSPEEASMRLMEPDPAPARRQPSIAKLDELLRLVGEPQSSLDWRTELLLNLEAFLHPGGSALAGQRKLALRREIYEEISQQSKPRTFPTHRRVVFSVALSPNGQNILSASADGTARIWDIRKGVESTVLKGHKDAVYGAAYSPDGSLLVTTSKDKTGRIWDTKSYKTSIVLRGHTDAVHRASFDLPGRRIVTASADGTAIIWNAESGKKLKTLKGHNGPVWDASFSPDGTMVVTGAKDGKARLWQADTGKSISVFDGHKSDVTRVVFSPDGNMIATTSRDASVRLWDRETAKEVAVLLGHKSTVIDVMFSKDGLYVITASFDQTARIWDLATRQVLSEFEVGQKEVRSAELGPDSKSLVTVSSDGTVSIWPVSLTMRELVENVLKKTAGCLAEAQRRSLSLTPNRPWWCRWRDNEQSQWSGVGAIIR